VAVGVDTVTVLCYNISREVGRRKKETTMASQTTRIEGMRKAALRMAQAAIVLDRLEGDELEAVKMLLDLARGKLETAIIDQRSEDDETDDATEE
jgi:hypothetical protein